MQIFPFYFFYVSSKSCLTIIWNRFRAGRLFISRGGATVVPRRITTCKKVWIGFFWRPSQLTRCSYWMGWQWPARVHLLRLTTPVWQFGSSIVAGSQGCIYLCDQVPRVYHGFPGPVCCSQGCSARNQLPVCGCQRSRRSPSCGIARVCDVRTTLSFRFLIPSWEDKSHCRKQTIYSPWH